MIQKIIKKLIEGENLTQEEATTSMDLVMRGEVTPAQIASFLTALRIKGETIEEITGFALSMRKHSLRVEINAENLVDTCGTGGDQSETFNISTISALVACGGGVKIVKHGNRSVSSKCGSADVLEEIGVAIDLTPEEVKESVEKIGFGFMFAPLFHKAMKNVAPVRKELGIRTVFNILGPLASPAGATAQVLGVFRPDLTELMAKVLKNLGVKHAYVVCGLDGIDELSTVRETKVTRLLPDGRIETYYLDCRELGINRANSSDIKGGDVATNARILKEIISGKLEGPKKDIVLMNAGAALLVGGKVTDLKQGIKMADEIIKSGEAFNKLKKLIQFAKKRARK